MDPRLQLAQQHFRDGVGHFEAGRLDEARTSFEESLALAPDRPSVLVNLGVTLYRLGQPAAAVPLLERAAAAEPGQADAWAFLGLSQQALEQWQPAAQALERALALAPGHAGLWLAAGRCHLALGAAEPALAAFDRAVGTDPESAAAWSERGSLLRELKAVDEAGRSFERALALGADRELHEFFLASVRAGATPPQPPRRYVEALFDEYAPTFQTHVVDKLDYRGHETLLRPLLAAGRRFPNVLDLGCGSGLCGPLIRPLADAIDGVDLSAAMLEQARRLGVYRQLVHGDLAEYLAAAAPGVDLVLAADVFIYVGDLAPVFHAVHRILAANGGFAFTLERAADGEDLRLQPTLRYAHSEAYVRRLAQEAGFTVRELFAGPLRKDQSEPVEGLYVHLVK